MNNANHTTALFVIFGAMAAGILLVAGASYGHESHFVKKPNELPGELSPATEHDNDHSHEGIEQALSEAVAEQIRPLREQLDRLEARTSLQDVLGAAGYIIGVTGIAFYFLTSRKIRRHGGSTGPSQQP